MLSTDPKFHLLIGIGIFWKKKKSHRLRSGMYGGSGTTGIPFLVKNSFTEMGSVTGSVVVLLHPNVRNFWPDTLNPFSESFEDLTLVIFINCCP